MADHHMQPKLCPNCGFAVNGTSNIDGNDKAPKAGDCSVCIACGVLIVFGTNLELEIMAPEYFNALSPVVRETLRAAQRAQQRLIDEEGPPDDELSGHS